MKTQENGDTIERGAGDINDARSDAHPSRLTRLEGALEITKALVLSLAALLSAWCGYQSAQWGGQMATSFSRANTMQLEAVDLTLLTVQVLQADLTLFNAWLDASAAADAQRTAAIEHLFSSQLRAAFDAWQSVRNTGDNTAGLTPFDMPEYQSQSLELIDGLNQQARTYFADALRANQVGDRYVFNTVLLALSLFLSGISDEFRLIIVRMVMRGLSIGIVIVGLVNLLSYPIL
jgi:hypothetical protein